MLHKYYSSLSNEEKQKFADEVVRRCRIRPSTVRSWVADPSKEYQRNARPVCWPHLSEISGIPEEELFIKK